MFTCVIPTLWKSRRIAQLVKDLCACEAVGEVIVIDNAPGIGNFTTDAAHKSLVEDHLKLKILKMEKNIYVNPAWNLGVETANFDDVALINDDVNFNSDVFKMFDDGSLVNNGVIGMAAENYRLQEDRNFQVQQHRRENNVTWGWGCIILVSKSNYVPIPDDLLIAYGDDWLSTRIAPLNTLNGLKVQTEMSTTSGRYNFLDIQKQDQINFRKKYQQKENHDN